MSSKRQAGAAVPVYRAPRRGKRAKPISNAEIRSPAERHAAMTWAQRLKRVFNIDPNAALSRPAAAAVDL
jgi:hypothetical protein